ncbi:MAG: DUF2254 domain-containing protein [Chryseolinea sp.]
MFKGIQNIYKKVITSIAFLPAIIALSFFVLSYLMIQFDYSSTGKNIKLNYDWLSLKDASTARSICTTIAGGLISLTVFSFSMVMILLSQAASQMSNRILGRLISNTFQQVVLGFYIGTTVYALFLLSAIRDIDTGIYVPALSTYLLITLTVVDIFLFIYFLHYITQSVKFETIIHRIFIDTRDALKRTCTMKEDRIVSPLSDEGIKIKAHKSGLYQGIQKASLANFCKDEDVVVSFLYPVGTYLIAGTPLLVVTQKKDIAEDFVEKLNLSIDIEKGEDIDTNYYYGFRQLREIAIKALSPGINDPGTAIIALQALGDLLAYRSENFPETCIRDDNGISRIFIKEKTFDEIFSECILPIWDYGKTDRLMQNEMIHLLTMLQMTGERLEISSLMKEARSALEANN